MRTTSEIIELAQDGEKPEYDELLYALLAVNFLSIMDKNKLYENLLADPPKKLEFRKLFAQNTYDAWRSLLNQSPKNFLGNENDPQNPEYQENRKLNKEIYSKFMKGAAQ